MSRLYGKRSWRDGTAPWLKRHNPICQALLPDGRQCSRASRVAHHLRDPRDFPEGSYDPRNLVCVCLNHHPGGARGESERSPARYVGTVGNDDVLHDHGWGAPEWRPEWDGRAREVLGRREEQAPGASVCYGRVTSLPPGELDKALDAED